MSLDINIIFIGVGIFPFRVAGDKNFLLDLKDYLNKHGIGTHFISITEKHKKIAPSDSITYIPRVFHYDLEKYYQVDTFENPIAFHHNHGVVRQFLELAVTLLVYRRKINKIISTYPNSIVHWTDMSLMMPFVKLVSFPVKTVYSTLRFKQRNSIVNRIVGLCASVADVTITSTEASRRILSQNGVTPSKIHISPWGVAPKPVLSEKKQLHGSMRLIWSGFIQQIGEADFWRTVTLAKRVLMHRRDIEFHFCLKPESFRDEFLKLQLSGLLIYKGDSNFLKNLGGFDGMLSPVLDVKSTVAPPLTWLEALAVGVPILTTSTLGVEEILKHEESGMIFANYEDLEIWLIKEAAVGEKLKFMRAGALDLISRNYSIGVVGERYVGIYRSVLGI